MAQRHPHVFGNAVVLGSGEVLTRWDEIKKWRRREKDGRKHICRIVSKCDMRMKNKVKFTFLKALAIKFKKNSTHLLARLGCFVLWCQSP